MRRASEHLPRINSSPRALSFYRTEARGHVVRNNDCEEVDLYLEPDDPDTDPPFGSEAHYARFPEQYPDESEIYAEDDYNPTPWYPQSTFSVQQSNRNFREELESGRYVPFIPLNENLEPVYETFRDRHPNDWETAVERIQLAEYQDALNSSQPLPNSDLEPVIARSGLVVSAREAPHLDRFLHHQLVRITETNTTNSPQGEISRFAPTSTSTPREYDQLSNSSRAHANAMTRNNAPVRQDLPGSSSSRPTSDQAHPNSLYVDKYVDLRSKAGIAKIE